MDEVEDDVGTVTDKSAVAKQDENTQHRTNDVSMTETESIREDRTLTDHLNKRLLEHFMQRLDGNDPSFPKVGRIDTSDPEDDLSDGVHKMEMDKNN